MISSTFDRFGNVQSRLPPEELISPSTVLGDTYVQSIDGYPLTSSGILYHQDQHQIQSSKNGEHPVIESGRKKCEKSCRMLLKEINDRRALRKILQCYVAETYKLGKSLGQCASSEKVRFNCKALLAALDREMEARFATSTALFNEDMGLYKETFMSKITTLLEEHRRRNFDVGSSYEDHQTNTDEVVRLNKIAQHAMFQSQKKKGQYSEAEAICNGLGEHPHFSKTVELGSDAQAISAYRQAAWDLEQLLGQLVLEEPGYHGAATDALSSHVGLLRTCPAPQLAYRVNDRRMALVLFEGAAPDRHQPDALHRSLLHYAVMADDVPFVLDIAKRHPQVIKTTGRDVFGMPPLAHAAVRKNMSMFNLLHKEDAPWYTFDTEGRSVMALAARAGNVDVVGLMLTFRPYPLFPCTALCQAVEGRHEGIARLILSHYREPSCYDADGLAMAGDVAHEAGLYALADEIRTVAPFFGTRTDALQDISAVSFDDFIQARSPHMPSSHMLGPVQRSPMLATTTLSSDAQIFTPPRLAPYVIPVQPIVSTQHSQWQIFQPDFPFQDTHTSPPSIVAASAAVCTTSLQYPHFDARPSQ